MKFEKFKAEHIAALEESVEYFANSMKKERELWVAREFLCRYVSQNELANIQSTKADPPDVTFHEINFEVKEVLDDGYKRHAEYKKELTEARSATKFSDFLKDVDVSKRITSIGAFLRKLDAHVAFHSKKYSKTLLSNLDALYYVNLRGVLARKISLPLVVPDSLIESGFRSVSLVFNDGSLVIAAKSNAPVLFRENICKLHIREN